MAEAIQEKTADDLSSKMQEPASRALGEQSNEQATQGFVDRRFIPEPYSENTKKLLGELKSVENQHTKLEKQLQQNGIAVSEEIPYGVAKDKIAEIAEQMKALNMSGEDESQIQKKYYALEEQMAKYSAALVLTDEWAEEQRIFEQSWEAAIQPDNVAALRKIRRHMSVNIRATTEEQLTSQPTPNGKNFPAAIARKFKRTNVLQLLRRCPEDIEKMHPSLLEALPTTGLTLTERRALYEHLKESGIVWKSLAQDPSFDRKWTWHESLKSKFKEMLNAYQRHVGQYGPPENHPYQQRNNPGAGGCPLLGNQCPIKADAIIKYDEDYGYTPDAEYEISNVETSNLDGTRSNPRVISAMKKSKAKASKIHSLGGKISEEAMLEDIRERLELEASAESDIDQTLLRELMHAEKRSLMLEKQLNMAGIAVAEDDISYEQAKEKIEELTEQIKIVAAKMGETVDSKEMANLEAAYGKVAGEFEKYTNAMMLTKEWAQEQVEKERRWEESIRPANIEALQKIRRHMPVKIREMSEEELTTQPTPNGKTLPLAIGRKFKRTNILLLLRMDPAAIEPMHPSSIESLRSTGLTLTERRALYEHLRDLGPKWKTMMSDKMVERKWMWHESLKGKFKDTLKNYHQHMDQYGPHEPGGCPLVGNQCPVKADCAIDYYSTDYGFPEGSEYDVAEVQKSKLLTIEDLEARKREEQKE
jgi:hypothetical protein